MDLGGLYNKEGIKSYKKKDFQNSVINFLYAIDEFTKEKNKINLILSIYNISFAFKKLGDINFTSNYEDSLYFYKSSLHYINLCEKHLFDKCMKNKIINLKNYIQKQVNED